jgi:hypothetical protein
VKKIVLRQEETQKSIFGTNIALSANSTTPGAQVVYILDLNYPIYVDQSNLIPTGGGFGNKHRWNVIRSQFRFLFTNQTGVHAGTSFAGPVRLYVDHVTSTTFNPVDLSMSGGIVTSSLSLVNAFFGMENQVILLPESHGQMQYDPNKCTLIKRRSYEIKPSFSGEACLRDINFWMGKRIVHYTDWSGSAIPVAKKNTYLVISATTGSTGTAATTPGVIYSNIYNFYKSC